MTRIKQILQTRLLWAASTGAVVGILWALVLTHETSARQATSAAVQIDNDDIGGTVTSTKGPEAGVWVIAETTELPTRYSKVVYGRIDDPKGSWKGRGLWASSGTRAPWHTEGGRGTRPKAVKFQLRPDPLAH